MARAIIAIAVLLLSAVVPADAQYFGRNKVQYGHFDFEILKTPHFDVYYYASEADAARLAATMAERWYATLSKTLDHTFTRPQPLILYASHSHFSQTTVIPGSIPEGVGGFTDHLAGRVVLPFAAGLGETDHVLGHEIVHAFQRDILRKRGRSLSMLPLWFSEGMAEHLSVGRLDPNTAMWLRDAVESGRLPTIAQLDDPKWFPYRYGQALWQFLATKYGDATVVKALSSRKPGAAARLAEATGKPAATLSTEWHEHIRALAKGVKPGGLPADAKRIISVEQNGGRMNVGPRLSPDGRYVVFLSERDGYSVDVFLAEADTGAIVRKLLSTAADPHFDSLQFIESAGAWDASGRQFVLASVRDGGPVLTIFDIPEGAVRREVPVGAVDEIYSPTWSPDGKKIAFSALKGGVTDLFALDLSSGELRQLTADPYSDLQPAWSPDGKALAFSTDRFSSSLGTLSFGRYQLAVLDIASGKARLVSTADGAKAIDPQWTPDGSAVYFVSDAGAVSNVHRVDLATGRTIRVTDVFTGISGVTALSPSISIGSAGKRVAMSLYSRGTYEIWTMDVGSLNAQAAIEPDAPLTAYEMLPAIALLPADATHVGEEQTSFQSRAYVPRLSLAQIGSPYLSAGGGAFGSFLRAGVSIGLSDMLGQQQVSAAIQVGKDTTDNAIIGSYMNRRSRWNWGVSGGRIPALVGASDVLTPRTSAGGDDVLVREQTVLQQIHRQLGAVASYPFSRSQRIEATFGVDSMTYDQRVTSSTFSAATRLPISGDDVQRMSMPGALMFQTGAALVYDTAVFGPTSPVLGQRYRFAIAPSFGDVRLLTTAADYRRYFMPKRPFTLAFRLQSVARTGPDALDERLLPLVWNIRDLVRGFDTDAETIRTSRFGVANAELRVPLLGTRGASSRFLPVEGLAFADCGRFWFPSTDPATSSLNARTSCSVGAGARLNAAGFVFEFHAARPLWATPNGGWRFGVNFQPGF